ncbi:hypothetical protein [Streptomyces sp. NPDC018972]|uniref:hypothetical protein n=1 Tax=Streptomyces sp. NPDC018972 TaxID=3365060 RepID=UPI003792AABE
MTVAVAVTVTVTVATPHPAAAPGTANALAADPVLPPLPATLSNPGQRAALLRLYAAEPAQALRMLLCDGLGVVAQQFAERHLPGSAEAVTVWGPRRLPLLAGGSGPRVLRLLVEQREKHGARAGVLTPWLPAAGAGRAGAERTVRLRRAGPRPRH